jgi:hypothetical protein
MTVTLSWQQVSAAGLSEQLNPCCRVIVYLSGQVLPAAFHLNITI